MMGATDVDALLGCLSIELAALDQLSFRLEEERLILSSGQHRFLNRATGEVKEAVVGLDSASRKRAALLAEAANVLGLPRASTLREIALATPVLRDAHRLLVIRRHLRISLENVRRVADENRQMLARGLAATADALSLLGASSSYDAAGGRVTSLDRPMLLDARA